MSSVVNFGIQRLNALPEVLEPSTMYLTPDPGDNTKVTLSCTSTDGTVIRSTFSEADILNLVRQEVNPFRTTVTTYDLPNVGDSCDLILDNIIRIHYEKTTNTGYEGYRVHLYSIGDDRVIGFRRDTIYDNTSAEGANSNALTLNSTTGYQSDSLSYGSMREVTRKIIVDYETMVSWEIRIYGFGTGKLRFVADRYQEST